MNLEELLDAGVHDDAEYGDGLANHRPMALVALHALGATDRRLQQFASGYRAQLRPTRAAEAWPAGEAWRSRFGQAEAWPAYRDLFAQWLIHEGRDAVLGQALPPLMRGCGAAAFHGLIRTALAIGGVYAAAPASGGGHAGAPVSGAGHAGELASGSGYAGALADAGGHAGELASWGGHAGELASWTGHAGELASWGGHAGELADGLAYWACRYLPLDVPAPAKGRRASSVDRQTDPAPVLQSLWRDLAGWHSSHALIVQRMEAAAQQPAFAAHVHALQVDEQTLPALSRLAARLYAASGHFTVLHLVTSAHAMRLLLPRLDDPLEAVRSYWYAYAAGAATVPALAGLGDAVASTPPDWMELTARALDSDDEHVIKLVYSCREEAQAHGGDEYRQAAARAAMPS